MRCGIKRYPYTVAPGLYGVGSPDKNSEVMVTANFKLSFNHLRKHLDDINAWILVPDTKGIFEKEAVGKVQKWALCNKMSCCTTQPYRMNQLSNCKVILSVTYRHSQVD